jgi:hypothetical protein
LPRHATVLLAGATIASAIVSPPAEAQVSYESGLLAGRAFMVDVDDPDPSGSNSLTVTFERRHGGSVVSLGVEAGMHEYLVLDQDLPPDVTGWSSKFEDTRRAWRVTPFARWGTRGPVLRVYGQVGMGLYVEEQYAATDVGAGINLGLGLELFPGKVPVGVALGLRSHAVLGGGDWFNSAEFGLVYRWGDRSRR